MQARSLPMLHHSGCSVQKVAFLLLEVVMGSEEISSQAA